MARIVQESKPEGEQGVCDEGMKTKLGLTKSLQIICVKVLGFDPDDNSKASSHPEFPSPQARGRTNALGDVLRFLWRRGHTYNPSERFCWSLNKE